MAYFNQLYDALENLEVDYEVVCEIMQFDPWVGDQHMTIHHKGYRGFGGKCLPKDARAMLKLGEEMTILREAILYNDRVTRGQLS